MKVTLTGVTGNMGKEALKEVLKLGFVDKVCVLILPDDKRVKDVKKLKNDKIDIELGNLADINVCKKIVEGADYVVNMAAVIPPHSDQFPQKAVECNELGVKNLVCAIESQKRQPKLIHISTVALYGNRNDIHPWARVGDPLLVSPFDIYSATKLRGEFCVLESNIINFAVLRQNAMLHNNLLSDNMSDGLMFHTCFNAPLEWVTAHDSGVLIANIIKRDHVENDLQEVFWRKVFNIGGLEASRVTGYDTLNDGFKLIGGSAKDYFEPNFNALRNFHGVWFYDGDKLDNLFHYRSQSFADFWKELGASHKYFKLACLVPKGLIKKFAIKRLFSSPNSPAYWYKHNDEAKLIAYFKSKSDYKNIPKEWKDFPLLVENLDKNGKKIDYFALKNAKNANLIENYVCDEVNIKNLKRLAEAHGGKLLSKKVESPYDKLEWQNADGLVFTARPATVMAGHFLNRTYSENVWEFDRLAKVDSIYASLWHDSHDVDENYLYYFDENFNAKVDKQ